MKYNVVCAAKKYAQYVRPDFHYLCWNISDEAEM
jgi:hypothetical protein